MHSDNDVVEGVEEGLVWARSMGEPDRLSSSRKKQVVKYSEKELVE